MCVLVIYIFPQYFLCKTDLWVGLCHVCMSVSRALYQSYLVFKLLMDDDVVLKNMVSRVLPRLKLGGCHGADGGCHGDAEI